MEDEVLKAESKLIEMANKFVSKEMEDNANSLINKIFAMRNIEVNEKTLISYLEGLRFSMQFVSEDKKETVMMFVLSVMKIKDTIEKNGRMASQD